MKRRNTCSGATATWLKRVVPLPLRRWPKPSQSSSRLTPGAVVDTTTLTKSLSSMATAATQSA
ncbi:hypothetical protein D3C78_1935120 [compost metagenome]